MKMVDYMISWLGHSGEAGEGRHEGFATMMLTGFLALMVFMVVI